MRYFRVTYKHSGSIKSIDFSMWIKVDDETIYHSAVGEIRKCIPVGEFIIIKVEELTVT